MNNKIKKILVLVRTDNHQSCNNKMTYLIQNNKSQSIIL